MSSTESEPSKKAVAAIARVVDSIISGGNVVHADVVPTVQKSPVCMHPQGMIDDWAAPSFDKVSLSPTFIASVPKSKTLFLLKNIFTYLWNGLAIWYSHHNTW